MRYAEAFDASPLNAGINRTGTRVVVGVRQGNHPQAPVVWAVQREPSGEWVDVDIINYPDRLEADADGWEPLLAWPTARPWEEGHIRAHSTEGHQPAHCTIPGQRQWTVHPFGDA